MWNVNTAECVTKALIGQFYSVIKLAQTVISNTIGCLLITQSLN